MLVSIFLGLGVLIYKGGSEIQEVVTKKSRVQDVREGCLINIIYGLILLIFQQASKIPMSTTFVFIGLLSGREIGMAIRSTGP